jgi:hypothetical protein
LLDFNRLEADSRLEPDWLEAIGLQSKIGSDSINPIP